MGKLIITADIHGFFGSWITMQNLLEKDDSLAIAGDLFDTRYGSYSNPDFAPEQIKKDFQNFKNPFYYVYGNCDTQSFFPGYEKHIEFKYNDKKIFLHHGHKPTRINDADIVIQGHTHLCSLEKKGHTIFLNPGSISLPRNNIYTYGIIEDNFISLVDLSSGKSLISFQL